jgi:hypothetical protein
MKKEIPVPAIAGAVVVLLGLVVFWFMRATGSETISRPIEKSPNYIEGIPDYVKEGRAPTADEMKAQQGTPQPGNVPKAPGS